MPSYKTHSIHGELILPEIDKKIEINKEDFKSFCMGPDAMILTDYKTFEYQHANKTKKFFVSMLKLIKKKKLYNNSETMAFLYGQIDHFVLDSVMHPLIYYMTENIEPTHKIKPHGLVEMWIDDYTTKKYNKDQLLYYQKLLIHNKDLIDMIDELYKTVYKVKKEGNKYSFGMISTVMFDSLVRRNLIGIIPLIIKVFNTGDFKYNKDFNRVLPYLNLDNKVWHNLETNEEYQYSFEDLWKKSIEISLETIDDVNKYIYQDKQLTNPFIINNISYNTGLPCEVGQSFKYLKKQFNIKEKSRN